MPKLVLDEPAKKPRLVLDEPEPPDYGRVAIPKEKLPGVWDYDKQLAFLSGYPDKDIEDFMPLDVQYDFGRIIGMTEKPDETSAKMKNTMIYSVLMNVGPTEIHNYTDAINKSLYGAISNIAAAENNKKAALGAKVTLIEKLKNFRMQDALAMLPFSPWHDYAKKSYAYAKKKIKGRIPSRPRWEMTPMGGYTIMEMGTSGTELKKTIKEYEEKLARGETIPATIFDGVRMLPAYMIEFAIGGSAAKAVGLPAKGIKAAFGAGVVRTALQPARVASSLIDQQMKEEGPATSLFKAYGDVYIENLSEAAGAGFVPLLRKMPFGSKLVGAMTRIGKKMKIPKKEVLERIATKAGWNGLIAEWGEERLGTELRAIFDVEDFGAGPDSTITERMAAGFLSDMRLQNQLVELGILSFPFATKMLATKIIGPGPIEIEVAEKEPEIEEKPVVKEVKAPPTEAIAEPEKIIHTIREMTPEEIAEDEAFWKDFPEIKKGLERVVERVPSLVALQDTLKKRIDLLKKVELGILTQEEADTLTEKFAEAAKLRIEAPTEVIPAPEAPPKPITPEKAVEVPPVEPEAVGVAKPVKKLPKVLPTEKPITLPEVQLFHNTSRLNAESILESGFEIEDITDLTKAERGLIAGNLGEGIYLSPNLEENMNIWGGESNLTVKPVKPLSLYSLGSEEGAASISLDKVDEIKRAGYDGIIVNDPHPRAGGYQIVVFDPKNLKVENIVEDQPIKAEPVKPKEPTKPGVSLLGGVPIKAPGLTRAEIKHLDKESQDALRAAQRRGLKVGYKQGAAETIADARRSLDAFRIKKAISQKGKMDVASVVLTYVPKEKQGDYIRRILEAKTQKRIERLTEAIDKYLDKYEKRQAIKGFKNFVKGIKKKYRRGEVALGRLPSKLRESLIEVLDKFDLAKISEKKEETLESRLKFVSRISGELANGFEGLNAEFDKDATDLLLMGKSRIDELKRLSQKYIGDLDVDEIRYIQASLEHLLKINDLKGKSKQRRRMENLRTDINNARQEVKPAKEKVVEWTGLLGAFRWIEVEGQSMMRSLVGLVTGKSYEATMKLLVHDPNRTNNDRKGLYKDFIMHFRKLADKANLKWKDVKKFNDRLKIKLGGKEIETDYASMLSILAHIEAEGNLRQLLKTKGLNITVYARDERGFITKKNIYRVGTPNLAELRAIVELVPEAHKKLLNVYFKTNWEKQAPAINEMSMKHQNYDLAIKKKYFHINREIERAVEGKKADISVSIDQQTRGLPRTGGTARINIVSFPLEVMETMQWSAAYATMTEAMENARTLAANPKWREAMKKAGNQRALKEITTMLRRSQGLITDQSILEAMAGKYLRQIGKSILSLRFSGGFVQTASMPAAIEFIDKKYLFNTDFPTPALIKHLKNIDPVLWLRWEGKQFDYALGMVGAQNAFEKLLFDHTPLTDKFLAPYTGGDEIAIAKLFMGAERNIEDTTKLKKVRTEKGDTEFEKTTLDLLHEAMTTQPQWDMLHRTPITSDPSMFVRPLTMFRSAIIAQRNVLVRAIDDYRKGRITKGQMVERIASVGMSTTLVVLSRHLFKTLVFAGVTSALVGVGLKEPPDEKEIKEEATKLAKKIGIQTVFTFVGLDIVGSLFASMGYKALQVRKYGWGMGRYGDIRTGNIIADVTLDVMQTGVDFVLFTEQIISGEKYGPKSKYRGRYKWEITGLRLIDEIAALFAYRYGLPYEGPKSDIIWPTKKALQEKKGIKLIEREKIE